MNATLIRSAYTPIIYEMKDCSVALLDAEHQVLGQSAGLPIFLGNLEICTRLTEETYGREAWKPGDVWVMNDSYLTGTHLNDMTVFGPIFLAGELIGFAACRAHWLDVGAKDAGRSDGLDRDLPGGHPRPAAAGRRGRRRARRRRRPARPQQPLLLPGDRRPRRADRVHQHRAGAAAGDRRAARARTPCSPRASRSSPRPSATSARRSRRSPTAATPPRAASTTTGSPASRAGSGSGSTCAATR